MKKSNLVVAASRILIGANIFMGILYAPSHAQSKKATPVIKNSFVVVDSCPSAAQSQSSGQYAPCTYFYDSITAMTKEKYGDKQKPWFKVKAGVAKYAEKEGYAPPNGGMTFINTLSGNAIIKDFADSINSSSKSLGINYVVSFYLLRSDVKFDSSYNVGFMGFGGGSKVKWTPIFELQYKITNSTNGKIVDQGVLTGDKIVAEDKDTFNAFSFSGVAKGGSDTDTTKLQMAIADSAAKQLLEKYEAITAAPKK